MCCLSSEVQYNLHQNSLKLTRCVSINHRFLGSLRQSLRLDSVNLALMAFTEKSQFLSLYSQKELCLIIQWHPVNFQQRPHHRSGEILLHNYAATTLVLYTSIPQNTATTQRLINYSMCHLKICTRSYWCCLMVCTLGLAYTS